MCIVAYVLCGYTTRGHLSGGREGCSFLSISSRHAVFLILIFVSDMICFFFCFFFFQGGARGLMVIVNGNGHSDTSSNPRRD